jgi:nitrate reductase molybdenum cofactor assembly chaperone NarJ/NarW
MGGSTTERPLYGLFAELLEYPIGRVVEAARACQALLAVEHPEAASLVADFAAMAEAAPPGRLEEIYTGTFDLNAICYPYVGYHLFGESYKRSALLVGLKERYRAAGLDTGSELADHVAVLLRFLSVLEDAGLASELVGEALLPALDRMTRNREEAESPDGGPEAADFADGREAYRRIVRALRLVLERQAGTSQGDRVDASAPAAPWPGTTP